MSAPDGVVDPSMEGYGQFGGPLSVAELERCFFLDDADLARVRQRRGDRNRVGFALQLGTMRYRGTFLADPTDVPTGVIDYVAGQVGAPDPSCVKGYLGRRTTRFDHAAEITAAYGYREFAGAKAELARWIDDRAWTTGEGPTALFAGAVRWLRARRVLLAGRSRLDRLVGQVRDQATQRLYGDLAGRVTPEQVAYLEAWLDVPDGVAVSNLDRLRSGPTVVSGKGLVAGLERAEEIAGAGWATIELGAIPARRVVELARWGMAAKAPALRRHPYPRRIATLLATAVYLEAEAVDDALELFNVLMVNDLMPGRNATRKPRPFGATRGSRPTRPHARLASKCCSVRPPGPRRSPWRPCGRRSTRSCREATWLPQSRASQP